MHMEVIVAKTKTSTAVKRRYNQKAYARLQIVIPKGRKEAVEEYARQHGGSVNGLVNKLLREELGMTEEEWKRADWMTQQTDEGVDGEDREEAQQWSEKQDVSGAFGKRPSGGR